VETGRLPLLSPPLVAALALLAAATTGVAMAHGVGAGIGSAIAIVYAPIALLSVPLGIALWIPIAFIQFLPFVWIGPTVASLLLLLAWIGNRRSVDIGRTSALRSHLGLVTVLILFLTWLSLSLVWARKPDLGLDGLWTWWVAALVLVIVATTIRSPKHLRIVLAAFVFGAVLSVMLGFLAHGLVPSASAIRSATHTQGRLGGGSGDPNYLAAGLVPAIVLAGALAATARTALARWPAAVAIALLGAGLAATESRGGLLAALAAVLAASAIFRRRRRSVALMVALVATAAAVWLASAPGAWHRVTSLDGGGNGRADLWQVAWRIAGKNPTVGVGLNNFLTEERLFVRRPGQLTAVALIVDSPHLVHNVYLQVLTETGIIGLGLFLALIAMFLRSPWRAARLFDARGDPAHATLARALLVAELSALVALFFISDGADERLWLLFGLGPVLGGLALRSTGDPAASPAS
jgi:O-antigen ligase